MAIDRETRDRFRVVEREGELIEHYQFDSRRSDTEFVK